MASTKQPMHETAQRLLAVGTARGAKDFSDIARHLNSSDQSATNWKARGVPANIMIAAAIRYDANIAYLSNGTDGPLLPSSKFALNAASIISKLSHEKQKEAVSYLQLMLELETRALNSADNHQDEE